MSDERRAAFDKEAEKERKAAEFEEEQRRQAALERRWELERQGVQPHSVGDVLASASAGMDRQDRRDKAAEARAAEALGQPEPRFDRWQAKANVKAYEAERETTAATQAELREVEQKITKLKSKIYALTGKSPI